MTIIFQYGSNTHSDRLNSDERLMGDARSIGLAYTEDDFELDFTTWSEGNRCAAADIVSGSGRKIWGVLYDVPDDLIGTDTSGDRRSFDAIEGKNYERISIPVRYADGSAVVEKVITYVVKNKRHDIHTSLEYASYIITGLREHNTPDTYIEYVKKQVVANNPDLKQDISKL